MELTYYICTINECNCLPDTLLWNLLFPGCWSTHWDTYRQSKRYEQLTFCSETGADVRYLCKLLMRGRKELKIYSIYYVYYNQINGICICIFVHDPKTIQQWGAQIPERAKLISKYCRWVYNDNIRTDETR